jgi:hypothetical protein
MREILAYRVATLAAALALGVCLAGPASAQIGVISATDGGLARQDGNVQVGQRIATTADGHAHLIFVDGSAVTVGPNSAVAIDNYSYDAASKKGALTLNVEQGAVRFVGGAISKTNDVEIMTPSGKVAIRGGIAIRRNPGELSRRKRHARHRSWHHRDRDPRRLADQRCR